MLVFTRDNSASRICRYFFVAPFVAYIKKNKKRNQKQEKRNETKCPNFTFSGNLWKKLQKKMNGKKKKKDIYPI